MNFKLIIILVFLFLGFYIAYGSLFDDLKKGTGLKKDEILVVIYQSPGSCTKCFTEPFALIELTEKNKGNLKFKYLALVRCDRELELKVFKRATGWKNYMFLDDGKASKRLGVTPNSILSFIDNNGEVLLDIRSGNYKSNRKQIMNLISDLK